MTTAFEAAQARVNAAALARLSNAMATMGAASFPVIFENGYAEALNFIGGSKPQIKCASGDVSGAAEGTLISINSVSYSIAAIHPDNTGISTLMLETA